MLKDSKTLLNYTVLAIAVLATVVISIAAISKLVSNKDIVLSSSNGTASATLNSTSSSNSTSADKCIITVNDKQYDVTNFKRVHPGGDVFDCGADMTDVYTSQHGIDYSRLVPYLFKEVTTSGN
ncbi:MAG: hypothetical protein Fur003_4380 [Candidatus Dojkabacteria bacterium]